MTAQKLTWKEVVEKVGEDAVATVVYLYFDELAREIDKRASDYADPAIIIAELADEDGSVDGDILNRAEERAWQRFRQEWRWLLPEPSWEEVSEVIWSLGG
jgi:hypothetical protein